MTKIALTSGAYQARSVIASAQRCLNLYIEPQPQQDGEPMPAAHYPTPGLRILRYLPELPVRAIRQANNGKIYAIAGKGVYRITPPAGIADWDYVHLGDITPGLSTPASMSDNGIQVLIVDGSANGWTIDLADDTFAQISDAAFFGADRVDFIDGYFLLNKPGTYSFYWSGAYATTFDPLDIASKNVVGDMLATLVVAKKEIFLLGERTTEVFYDAALIDPVTGFVTSQFAGVQGVFIDHGCAAKYSAASYDNTVFWLSRSRSGKGLVMMAAASEAKRISTWAIDTIIAGYKRIDDAYGWTYQNNGHALYVLTFPTDDRTWVYDLTTGEWHEWLFTDFNGNEHAHRAMCAYPCFGTLLAGDRQYGNLYALENGTFTDLDFPIKRERCFPHMVAEGRRVFYREFLADMETGAGPDVTDDNLISLAWSDDRGRHFGNPVSQSAGGLGDTLVSLQWQRLGMARDRVFRLCWSLDAPCALQGAWITYDLADAPEAAPKKEKAPA